MTPAIEILFLTVFTLLSPEAVVRRSYEAFNRQDARAFVQLVADDVRWMSVAGEQLRVELVGREALEQYLVRYFRSLPSARSVAEASMRGGEFVSVHERVTWRRGEAEATQSAVAVYRVRNGRITDVWYFDAKK